MWQKMDAYDTLRLAYPVLLYCVSGVTCVGMPMFDSPYNRWVITHTGVPGIRVEPLYWQPLPPPPREATEG